MSGDVVEVADTTADCSVAVRSQRVTAAPSLLREPCGPLENYVEERDASLLDRVVLEMEACAFEPDRPESQPCQK